MGHSYSVVNSEQWEGSLPNEKQVSLAVLEES